MTDTDGPVVTVTPTIEDGTVVRWYIHEAAAENGYEFMSASRNGVMIRTFLHQVPAQDLADANAVHDLLQRGKRDEVQRYATHRRDGLRGPLVAVAKPCPATAEPVPCTAVVYDPQAPVAQLSAGRAKLCSDGKATCPDCGGRFQVTKSGGMRHHNGDISVGGWRQICSGIGKTPREASGTTADGDNRG